MLNPSAADLLAGVADALARTVVEELPAGPARDQVQGAVGLLRRLAGALPHLAPYLQEDTRDLAATLRRLWTSTASTASTAAPPPAEAGLEAALAAADALPAAPLPSLDALTAANLRLREAVAHLAEAADLDAAAEQDLRALLGRLAVREAALGPSPWERTPRRPGQG